MSKKLIAGLIVKEIVKEFKGWNENSKEDWERKERATDPKGRSFTDDLDKFALVGKVSAKAHAMGIREGMTIEEAIKLKLKADAKFHADRVKRMVMNGGSSSGGSSSGTGS